MTSPVETAKRRGPKKGAKARPRANFDDIVVTEVSAAPGAFNNGLSEDHEVVQAFTTSYETGESYRIGTTTPDLVVKALKSVANKRNLSVTTRVEGDAVVLQARDKRERKQ